MTTNRMKSMLALIPAALALAGPALAQQPHLNPIQRHPTLTGLAAAAATHHALKVAAHNREMHGQKLNFAERHPTMSAIGAGMLTHHEIKAHTPH